MNASLKIVTGKKNLRWVLGICLVALIGSLIFFTYFRKGKEQEPQRAQLVRAAVATVADVPMYISALGTVTPENTVLVRSRVDGELMDLFFTEGQEVAAGTLLAQIDQRPYEVKLKEAEGNLARDMALLKDARLDLARYKKLLRQEAVSVQQVQAQEALVGQYEGSITVDEASIANAQLQISYCHITAPISGRLGLKRADKGSMIRASDSGGLVVITQMDPMHVVFTIVEKQVPMVLEAMKDGTKEVEAWNQDGKSLLAKGSLMTLDNQIDTATGTVKAKAVFSNADGILFPNQFVYTRLLLKNLDKVLTIPASAVQRNNDGFFVYVINENTVSMRPITLGYTTDTTAVVETGLTAGETIVTDGVDRLRQGSQVRIITPGEGKEAPVE